MIREQLIGVTISLRVATLASLLIGTYSAAQVPVDENGNPIGGAVQSLSEDSASSAQPLAGVRVEDPTRSDEGILPAEELETLVGPIALYPDDLLAIVLPASTYPLEIVQAARFLDAQENDSSLEPDEAWDDSIVALLNYPDVLRKMNDDIDWTWRLGEAVVAQQNDVIAAVESFRDRAYLAGNLKSDQYQTVTVDDGVIEIEPVADDVIYVPYYEPERVVHVSPRPVYHYYPDPYPVYYYPYATRHYYRNRPFWGVTTAFTIGWATDRLHVYHNSYHGHPYFGHSYYGAFWRRPSIHVYNSYYVDRYRYRPRNRYLGDYWRPRHRSGARPRSRSVDNYYVGPRRDRRERRADTRNQRQSGNRRFSDTIRNATRAGTNNARRSSNRAANPAISVQRNAAQRNNAARNRSERRATNRDAITFRDRGNGRFTANRDKRVRFSNRNRDNDAVRLRGNVDRSAGARQTRTVKPRDTRRAQQTRRTANRRVEQTRRTTSNTQRRGFTTQARSQPQARVNRATQRPRVSSQSQRRGAAAPQPSRQSARSANRAQRAAAPQRSNARQQTRRSSSASNRSNRSSARRGAHRKQKR